MSDFLSHLAARSIAAPALRPRVRMRFEPPSATPAAADPAPLDTTLPDTAVPPVSAPPLASVEDRISARGSSPRDAEAAIDREQVPRPISATSATRRDVAIAVTAEPRPLPRHETDGEVEAGVERVPVRTTARPARPDVSDARPGRRGATEAQAAVPPEVPAKAGDVRRGAERPPIARLEVASAELPHMPVTSAATGRRTAAAPAPNRWSRRAERHQPSPAADAPVVHVSIGRVEVRATPAPAAAVPATRRSQAMTIDEYVERRRGRS